MSFAIESSNIGIQHLHNINVLNLEWVCPCLNPMFCIFFFTSTRCTLTYTLWCFCMYVYRIYSSLILLLQRIVIIHFKVYSTCKVMYVHKCFSTMIYLFWFDYTWILIKLISLTLFFFVNLGEYEFDCNVWLTDPFS